MVGGRQHQATGRTSKVCDSLQGNAVFTARLLSSGNMVLVHPMEERGEVFLPCCYGYATTIRRAQGADLSLGCIYMDHKFPAGRGYGYVACSRFKTRAGCFLYGKLRRTDFLPVGEVQKDEVLERGYYSVSSDDDDGRGLEYAFAADDVDNQYVDELDPQTGSGNVLADFAPYDDCTAESVSQQ